MTENEKAYQYVEDNLKAGIDLSILLKEEALYIREAATSAMNLRSSLTEEGFQDMYSDYLQTVAERVRNSKLTIMLDCMEFVKSMPVADVFNYEKETELTNLQKRIKKMGDN